MGALEKTTVLVLDDNPLVLKLARALLEREGSTVLTASSWIEFNHVLAANTPDIILLDVNLPSIKGNRLSEVLKSQSNKKDIPIVLISDLPEKSLEDKLKEDAKHKQMADLYRQHVLKEAPKPPMKTKESRGVQEVSFVGSFGRSGRLKHSWGRRQSLMVAASV